MPTQRTLKEAILISLGEINELATYMDVYNHILKNKLFDFGAGKTPASTVSATIGSFIRKGDTRVKRIKRDNGTYAYYLSKNEHNIKVEVLDDELEQPTIKPEKANKVKSYEERDLHKLLSSYLKNTDTYSKTIFHQQSNGKDSNQIWTHPDMVGIKFLNLQTKASQNFLKSINRVDTFKLSSYELKKEINNDSELKNAFFQAVSNSSWANYGYLVAFEFSDSLQEEMSRLSQSFGIGIIQLKANPYQSRILYPATFRTLDFKTIDKLCKMNKAFERFIEQTEKLMTANEKYVSGAEKELEEFCDSYFETDADVENYCKEKLIPNDDE
jgi:uncharacterized protein